MTTDVVESKVEEVPKSDESSETKDEVKTEVKEVREAPAAESPEKSVKGDEDGTYDPFYPPIVSLPLVEVKPGEEGEVEVFKRRAKLYRLVSRTEFVLFSSESSSIRECLQIRYRMQPA